MDTSTSIAAEAKRLADAATEKVISNVVDRLMNNGTLTGTDSYKLHDFGTLGKRRNSEGRMVRSNSDLTLKYNGANSFKLQDNLWSREYIEEIMSIVKERKKR